MFEDQALDTHHYLQVLLVNHLEIWVRKEIKQFFDHIQYISRSINFSTILDQYYIAHCYCPWPQVILQNNQRIITYHIIQTNILLILSYGFDKPTCLIQVNSYKKFNLKRIRLSSFTPFKRSNSQSSAANSSKRICFYSSLRSGSTQCDTLPNFRILGGR